MWRPFWHEVCYSNTSYPTRVLKNEILENLISSPVIWDLATSSELGKTALASLVDAQIIFVDGQLNSASQTENVPHHANQQETPLRPLSSCLRLIMMLEKQNHVPEPCRLASIFSSLAKLKVRQLCHFFVDVLKSNSERLKKLPCSVVIIRELCDLLLLRLKEANPADGPSWVTNLETLKCFIQIGDETLTRRLLEQICAVDIAVISLLTTKCEFWTKIVSSSDIWGKLDSGLKLLVLNTCSTIAELEIQIICKHLVSNGESISQFLQSKLSICIQFFFLTEKNRISPDLKCVAPAFQPVIDKLPITSLMDLVFEIHLSESKKRPNIKKFPACMDF